MNFFECLTERYPNVPSWATVGFSVVIYVKWFKTEVNHSGKPAAAGAGGAAAHARERPGVFVTPHIFLDSSSEYS